jgi:hypothetical protein
MSPCDPGATAGIGLCFQGGPNIHLNLDCRIVRVSAFPALALAIALTYVIGDFFRPHLPQPISIVVDIVLCFVIYKISHHYLNKLRE